MILRSDTELYMILSKKQYDTATFNVALKYKK